MSRLDPRILASLASGASTSSLSIVVRSDGNGFMAAGKSVMKVGVRGQDASHRVANRAFTYGGVAPG